MPVYVYAFYKAFTLLSYGGRVVLGVPRPARIAKYDGYDETVAGTPHHITLMTKTTENREKSLSAATESYDSTFAPPSQGGVRRI